MTSEPFSLLSNSALVMASEVLSNTNIKRVEYYTTWPKLICFLICFLEFRLCTIPCIVPYGK